MITKLSHITVLVKDIDEALDFYVGKLGLVIKDDVTWEGLRWVTIQPKGQDIEIPLLKATTPKELELVGKQAGESILFVFATDNCEKTYKELKDKGVKFQTTPTKQIWGIEAIFEDIYGNKLDLVQPAE